MKRPRGFIILSLFFLYITVAGITKGLQLSTEYGIVPVILGLFYGLSAMVVAIGLWLFRSWVLHATIFFSLSLILWLFNWQYGLQGKYTLSLHIFILYSIFICLLLLLLIYYVQKKLKEIDKGERKGNP